MRVTRAWSLRVPFTRVPFTEAIDGVFLCTQIGFCGGIVGSMLAARTAVSVAQSTVVLGKRVCIGLRSSAQDPVPQAVDLDLGDALVLGQAVCSNNPAFLQELYFCNILRQSLQSIRMCLSDDPTELLHQLRTIEKIVLACTRPNKAFEGQRWKEVQEDGMELQQVAMKKMLERQPWQAFGFAQGYKAGANALAEQLQSLIVAKLLTQRRQCAALAACKGELARRQQTIDVLEADKEQQDHAIHELQSSVKRAEADQQRQAVIISTLEARLADHTPQAASNQQGLLKQSKYNFAPSSLTTDNADIIVDLRKSLADISSQMALQQQISKPLIDQVVGKELNDKSGIADAHPSFPYKPLLEAPDESPSPSSQSNEVDSDQAGCGEQAVSPMTKEQLEEERLLDIHLPDPLPEFPQDTARQEGTIFVHQLSALHWHLRARACLMAHKLLWKGGWDLVPAGFRSPYHPETAYFRMSLASLGTAGSGSYGTVEYHERWAGQGTPGTPQPDGTTGFQAVAVKLAPLDDTARQERRTLRAVQKRIDQLNVPGPHHITTLLDMWKIRRPQSETQVLITKFEEGLDLDDAFDTLFDRVELMQGPQQTQALGQMLFAAGQALKQVLQGVSVMHDVGLVHCDLKGNNVKAHSQPDASQMHAVVVDLGCSQLIGASCVEVMGARAHAAPEVIRALLAKERDLTATSAAASDTHDDSRETDSLVTPALDIWSAGCVLYRMLTGEDVFLLDDSDSESDNSKSASGSRSSRSASGKQLDGSLAGEDVHDKVRSMHQLHLAWVQQYKANKMPEALSNLKLGVDGLQHERYGQAADLLWHMLHPDVQARWSISQIVAHPFCQT